MVGRLKISHQAEQVRQLFMEFEKAAKKIQRCFFCGGRWSHLKQANQGHLRGDHKAECPFAELAEAGERCIIVRDDSEEIKRKAEKELSDKIDALFAKMTKEVVPDCPFPACRYPFDLGHRLECPFRFLKDAR
jgi:hypothetical protein